MLKGILNKYSVLAIILCFIIAFILFLGGCWVISILLNPFLTQMGLHAVNTFGVAGLVVAEWIIYKYITL